MGVPILDWVLLIFVLGLGIEAWLTIRSPSGDDVPSDPESHTKSADVDPPV